MNEKKQKDRRYSLRDPRAVCCRLCGEELYPGDCYYQLEGGRVCEACLERYARWYFAPQLHRISEGRAVR